MAEIGTSEISNWLILVVWDGNSIIATVKPFIIISYTRYPRISLIAPGSQRLGGRGGVPDLRAHISFCTQYTLLRILLHLYVHLCRRFFSSVRSPFIFCDQTFAKILNIVELRRNCFICGRKNLFDDRRHISRHVDVFPPVIVLSAGA